MKTIKHIIILATISIFTLFTIFSHRVNKSVNTNPHKELPILQENQEKENILTSSGILLVGLSSYILISTFEKAKGGEK